MLPAGCLITSLGFRVGRIEARQRRPFLDLLQATANHEVSMQVIWLFLIIGILAYQFLVGQDYLSKAADIE
jgi:hypothetical protein